MTDKLTTYLVALEAFKRARAVEKSASMEYESAANAARGASRQREEFGNALTVARNALEAAE